MGGLQGLSSPWILTENQLAANEKVAEIVDSKPSQNADS